jgi:hypothetical protein
VAVAIPVKVAKPVIDSDVSTGCVRYAKVGPFNLRVVGMDLLK